MAADIPPEMPHGLAAIWHAIAANIDDAKALLLAAVAGVTAWAMRVERRLRELTGMSGRVGALETKATATDGKLDAVAEMVARIDERTALMLHRLPRQD